jgi:hypothetical protein
MQTENRTPCLTVPLLFCVSVLAETPHDPKIPCFHGNLCWISVDMRMCFRELLPSKRSQSLGNTLIYPSVFVAMETCFNKPLPSNGRLFWFQHSGFQAPCHNIKYKIMLSLSILQLKNWKKGNHKSKYGTALMGGQKPTCINKVANCWVQTTFGSRKQNIIAYFWFVVLTLVSTRIPVFWDVTPCSLVDGYHFRRYYCSTSRLDAASSSLTLVPIYQTTGPHIAGNSDLNWFITETRASPTLSGSKPAGPGNFRWRTAWPVLMQRCGVLSGLTDSTSTAATQTGASSGIVCFTTLRQKSRLTSLYHLPFEIWHSHADDYEHYCLLGGNTM